MVTGFDPPVRPDVDMERLRSHRLGRIRAEMTEADVAMLILVNPVSLRYAADWREYATFQSRIPTYYLFVPIEGPLVMHGAYSTAGQVIDEFRMPHYMNVFDGGLDLRGQAKDLAVETSGFLADLGLRDGRIGIEHVNPSVTQAFGDVGVPVVDAEPVMELARYRKSADELTCIEHSVAVAEFGMSRMREALSPGITENALWSVLHATNIEFDGDWFDGRMLVSGPRTNPWYQEASDREIEEGDLVAFDTDMIGPFGYCADISRTWLCGSGPPTQDQRDLYRRAHEEVAHNISLLRSGLSFRELSDKAFRQPERFEAHRYACLAHGVGMTDEYPKIYYRQDWDDHGYDGEIESGTVLSVESFVGSDEGGPGVKLEEMVIVTEEGAERVSSYPFEEAWL